MIRPTKKSGVKKSGVSVLPVLTKLAVRLGGFDGFGGVGRFDGFGGFDGCGNLDQPHNNFDGCNDFKQEEPI